MSHALFVARASASAPHSLTPYLAHDSGLDGSDVADAADDDSGPNEVVVVLSGIPDGELPGPVVGVCREGSMTRSSRFQPQNRPGRCRLAPRTAN